MGFDRNARELHALEHDPAPATIGITGGIASGKTVATDALRAAGYTIIDADEISRELFGANTDGEKLIAAEFARAVDNDGVLDRKKLRGIISDNAAARVRLNELTHPVIIAEIKRRIETLAPPVVLSAPLLFESALARLCDITVCVYCPRSVKIARLTARDGISRDDAAAMIDAQIPDTERCSLADLIVPSDCDIELFEKEIVELFDRITKKK